MSIYTTKDITREKAEDMIMQCRAKTNQLSRLSDTELDTLLHEYVYSEEHDDVFGWGHNFNIK